MAVDIVKLEINQKQRISLRARIFANVENLFQFAQPYASLVNFILRWFGKIIALFLGTHSKRSFPILQRQTFSSWYKISDKKTISNGKSNQIVFFHDTFMEYTEAHIGQAAIKVLDTAGFETIILYGKCDSGRPALSNGFLDDAVKLAHHNIELLSPYAKRGIPIVGCDPSVMAMLVNEYRDLVPGESAQSVAMAALMLDELIVREVERGNIYLRFDNKPRQVLFHGQCHQKAIFGTKNTHKMLRLIPNLTVKEINASCCGMAGSFGYEKEHYDQSIQLAEMSLAPTIRSADPTTIICAMGTTCRDQIKHTTSRIAVHPIEILADALVSTI